MGSDDANEGEVKAGRQALKLLVREYVSRPKDCQLKFDKLVLLRAPMLANSAPE